MAPIIKDHREGPLHDSHPPIGPCPPPPLDRCAFEWSAATPCIPCIPTHGHSFQGELEWGGALWDGNSSIVCTCPPSLKQGLMPFGDCPHSASGACMGRHITWRAWLELPCCGPTP